jgi:hypothetical protein
MFRVPSFHAEVAAREARLDVAVVRRFEDEV